MGIHRNVNRVPRMTVRWMMLAVAVMALALACLPREPVKLGCGSASVLLTFRVVDDRDRRPIAGATIEISSNWSAPSMASVNTGADGLAAANCRTGATSYSTPLRGPYRCLSYGEGLRIEAEGYQSVDGLLRNFTNSPAYHNSSAPPPILVRLEPTTIRRADRPS